MSPPISHLLCGMRGNPIQAGFYGLETMDCRHQRHPVTSIPVTGSGLDSDEANAAIGLVTRAAASIMTGSCLVSGEVGAGPDRCSSC